ncbi:FAD-binding oxidoreductase [Tessaracoccus sp. SD287]|uniref:FAD-binding and (Fe-S)-binding domain-containing protein n=1 Tax=Tessaracoccus sp. SD287 TaxID=2782008 RepID=UPI001A96CA34|nr:FAD-binding and (Fe-S)-binding domain-containing protein [Tessaracoccus sp. SD287]MBO1031592.1 FAD-binding oxidoreductase [Tessaracoccus sp. SD287]
MQRSIRTPAPPSLVTDLEKVLRSGGLSTSALDIATAAVDASHYLLSPQVLVRAGSAAEVALVMQVAHQHRRPVTFRSGGTSLSGQALSSGILVDTRAPFRDIEVLDDGARVRVGPGRTIREVNAFLAPLGHKLGPDPASEIACTVGGVVANNSSGMTCGVVANTYQTLESLVLVLPSGTVVDTGAPDADALLRAEEPQLYQTLLDLRERALPHRDDIARRWSMKNTMGYGLNSLVDHERPVKILEHLMVGSEGTLGFIAEATFRTVPVLPKVATGLLLFDSLHAATSALPALVDSGAAVVELLDAISLQVCRADPTVTAIPRVPVPGEAALLVEYQAGDADQLAAQQQAAAAAFTGLDLRELPLLTDDAAVRAELWALRKGLFTKVNEARRSGTTALLEDIAVPVPTLAGVCEDLQELFDRHHYGDSVIFGHAKDGNIHFMITEDFNTAASLPRYEAFTEDMVAVVLEAQGTLKAEHGTGRIMAPFVERQYGPELYQMMRDVKQAFDPHGVLNPDSVLTDNPQLHMEDLKQTPTVQAEVDRCVECGYCEPVCPSQFLTLTPRQRIVAQRAIADAESRGDHAHAELLRREQTYPVSETCAVDGMCATACPVGINTGDLVRRLRAEHRTRVVDTAWDLAARAWGPFTAAASAGMTLVDTVPQPLVEVPLTAARTVFRHETVPILSGELPGGGGVRRARRRDPGAEVVYLPACVQTMFGPEDGVPLQDRVLSILDRAGVKVTMPQATASLCCGTPWKSKGMATGFDTMSTKLARALLEATDNGRLPVISDALSCSEGIIASLAHQEPRLAGVGIRVLDATTYLAAIADRLPVVGKVPRAAVHPTCSSTRLGATGDLLALAHLVADEVVVPTDWRCCGFAGDRGLLHPELTASATRDEAAELAGQHFDLYLSANRTCELGLTRATGQTYVHVLAAWDDALRLQQARA